MTTSAGLACSAAGPTMKETLPDRPRFSACSLARSISRPLMSMPVPLAPGRGLQDPQQELSPSAAVLDDARGAARGQVGGEAVSTRGGQRFVKRQLGTGAEAGGIGHRARSYASISPVSVELPGHAVGACCIDMKVSLILLFQQRWLMIAALPLSFDGFLCS